MDFEIDANLLKSMMGGDEATSENSGNPQRAAQVKADKDMKEKLKKENDLKKARLTLEEKIYKSMLREEKYRQTIVQGIFSANNKLLGQEMLASIKKQNAQGKEVSTLDILKKKYAWQLLYFTAVATLFSTMVSNSKLFAAFTDMIGSGLGFILDMLLTAIIPYVVITMEWLFKIGQFFSGLPDLVKICILALGTLFAIFTGAQASAWLLSISTGITGIGTEAALATPLVSGLVGAFAGIAIAGFILNLKEVKAALKGLSDVTEAFRISDAGKFLRDLMQFSPVDWIANGINATIPGYNFLTASKEKEMIKGGQYNAQVMSDIRRQDPTAGYSGGQYTTSVAIWIDGEAINSTLYKQKLVNGVG